jgi:hypothetical protein
LYCFPSLIPLVFQFERGGSYSIRRAREGGDQGRLSGADVTGNSELKVKWSGFRDSYILILDSAIPQLMADASHDWQVSGVTGRNERLVIPVHRLVPDGPDEKGSQVFRDSGSD